MTVDELLNLSDFNFFIYKEKKPVVFTIQDQGGSGLMQVVIRTLDRCEHFFRAELPSYTTGELLDSKAS